MHGSLATGFALILGALSLLTPQASLAEGDSALEGEPLLTSLDVDGNGAQFVTVLDVGSGVGVFEGDVLVPLAFGISNRSSSVQAQSFSLALGGSLWPDGIMPYSFDSSLSSTAQVKIEQAIAHWNASTPIRLVPRSTQDDYVNFVNESGCASYIGRIGGAQPVYSSPNCSAGNFIHEIGHALGLYHEHTRPDRDAYVTVNWSNVSSSKSQNFDIVTSNIQVNTPYDYGSIMHYGNTFFSINGQETITPKQAGTSIGQRIALSSDDITGINMLYSAGFEVEFELAPRRPMPDATLLAEIELSNTTGGTIQSLTATSSLPTSVVFQQANGSGWSCSISGQSLNCSGPSLQNGASTTLELTMQAPSGVSNLDFNFNLAGTSSGGASIETDVLRTLTMTAVNDPPELEIGQTEVAVIPLSDVSRAITRVKAEDPNGHTLSNFALTSQSHPGVFEIDADTGDIFALSSDAVNALEGETATLGVTVSDGFSNASETIVEIDMLTSDALTSQGSSASGGGAFMAFWLLLFLPLRRLTLSSLKI